MIPMPPFRVPGICDVIVAAMAFSPAASAGARGWAAFPETSIATDPTASSAPVSGLEHRRQMIRRADECRFPAVAMLQDCRANLPCQRGGRAGRLLDRDHAKRRA